jgi:AmmeMemoRadiSam system protein A
MFEPYKPPELTKAQQQELLKLARMTITTYLQTGYMPEYETEDTGLILPAGAFVTLRSHDGPIQDNLALPKRSLRGCIGHIQADTPLYQVVQTMAVASATSDPRLPPLRLEEVDGVHIEISVLSSFYPVSDIQQVQLGVHGLMLVQGGRRGLLLPQVPLERGWDRNEFLEHLCLKAGLPTDCWDQSTLYAFTTVVFEE